MTPTEEGHLAEMRKFYEAAKDTEMQGMKAAREFRERLWRAWAGSAIEGKKAEP